MPHGPMKITRRQKIQRIRCNRRHENRRKGHPINQDAAREEKVEGSQAIDQKRLQNLARTLLDFATCRSSFTTWSRSVVSLFFDSDDRVDGKLKHLVDTSHFFAAALDVSGPHALRDSLALFGRDWCQALGFEELDTCAFVAEVGFEADEDEGGCWTEMEHFWVPLDVVSVCLCFRRGRRLPCP